MPITLVKDANAVIVIPGAQLNYSDIVQLVTDITQLEALNEGKSPWIPQLSRATISGLRDIAHGPGQFQSNTEFVLKVLQGVATVDGVEDDIKFIRSPGLTEFMTELPEQRFVIYMMCKVLGLKYEHIYEHSHKIIGCNEYLPANHDFGGCGCDYAPPQFHKRHISNNYEDSISYSKMPYTHKLGVRVFMTGDRGRGQGEKGGQLTGPYRIAAPCEHA